MTSNELKEARLALGLTQQKMAAKLMAGYRTYQSWEEAESLSPKLRLNIDMRWAYMESQDKGE